MDGHVGLLPPPDTTDHWYDVVIGGYNNQQSEIRRWPSPGIAEWTKTPNILNCDQYRHFWVDWDKDSGKIRLGSGLIPGSLQLISWTDPDFLVPETIAISTWQNNEGDWEIEQRQGTGILYFICYILS